MSLHSLVLCSDNNIMRTLRRVLSDLEISLEHCAEADMAVRRLTRRKFEAVIVDCDDEDKATEVLTSLRSAPRNKRAIAVAIIGNAKEVSSAFRLGAHFVLHKPITLDRARGSFRAARALMKCERRQNARVTVQIPVSLIGDGKKHQAIVTSDLGEGGMAIKFSRWTKPTGPVRARFELPGVNHVVECPIEIAWEGAGLEAGIRFVGLSREHRDQLRMWLNRCSPDLEPPDPPVRCKLTDLSPGGCYLRTETPFPMRTRVVLIVRTSKSAIYADAVVRIMHPDLGMGLEFVRDTDQAREQVEHLLQSLNRAKGTLPDVEVEPEGLQDGEIRDSRSTDAPLDSLLDLFHRSADRPSEDFQAKLSKLRNEKQGAVSAASA